MVDGQRREHTPFLLFEIKNSGFESLSPRFITGVDPFKLAGLGVLKSHQTDVGNLMLHRVVEVQSYDVVTAIGGGQGPAQALWIGQEIRNQKGDASTFHDPVYGVEGRFYGCAAAFR